MQDGSSSYCRVSCHFLIIHVGTVIRLRGAIFPGPLCSAAVVTAAEIAVAKEAIQSFVFGSAGLECVEMVVLRANGVPVQQK